MEKIGKLEDLLETQRAALGQATMKVEELTTKFGSYDEVVTSQKEELVALKSQFEETLTAMNRTDVGAGAPRDELAQLQTKEFIDWSMRGKEYNELQYTELGDFEKKMLSSDNLRTGGHWMPTTMYNKVLEEVVHVDSFRQVANTVRLSEGDTLEGLYESGTLDAAWTTERATVTEKATPEIDKWEIPTHPMYVYPRITQKMARLAAFDVENWLMSKYTQAFAYLEGIAFLTGTGVGQPMGLMTVAKASTNTPEAGILPTQGAGVGVVETGATTITDFDCLKEMVASLDEQYQANGSWIMNRATYLALDKLADADAHYFMQPDVKRGSGGLLLGKPINFMYSMDAPTDGLYPIAYGDFKQAYTIVDAPGAFVVRDEATDFGRIVFKTERLGVGGDVIDFDAFCILRVEA